MQTSTYFDSWMQREKSTDILTTMGKLKQEYSLFTQFEDHEWLWMNNEEF